MAEMEEVAEPRKIKLRRVKPHPPEELIQKNLEPLKENIKKKIRAQELFYHKQDNGVSPLIRDIMKRPVHQRLGRKHPNTLGTNTSAIPPKRRLRRLGNPQLDRRTRIFSAQQRLNIIRARQRERLFTQGITTQKKIKLRRTLPQILSGPTNLKVEVKNNSFFNRNQFSQSVRRFRQILNSQLQLEIKKIQMEFSGFQSIEPMSITPKATKISLHKRFAELF